MWQVWTADYYAYPKQYLYGIFETKKEAEACRDEYNEWADETFAYIVEDVGD
jgi:hypothetical protein